MHVSDCPRLVITVAELVADWTRDREARAAHLDLPCPACRPPRCDECGHDPDRHYQTPTGYGCGACNGAADVGQYAPCADPLAEPWNDADDAELARAMSDAAYVIRERHSHARWMASDQRRRTFALGGYSVADLDRFAPQESGPSGWHARTVANR
jgi:hypothetical protein